MLNKPTLLWRQTILPSFSLLTSMGTLLCCALPALLVSLGLGASLAGLISAAPWLTVIASHKPMVFSFAGIMLVLATILQWRARQLPCPADPLKAKACRRMRQLSWTILVVSMAIYGVGGFFAFFAADLFY